MHKITTIIVLASVLVGLAPSARAADEGGIGAVCAPEQRGDRENISFSAGGAWNVSTSRTAKVVCSTVRLTQGSPRNINVDYFDGSATAGVSCLARARDFAASQIIWEETKSSGASTIAGNFFPFTMPSGVIGNIIVTCTLPASASAQSGVIGFNVQ